MAIITKQHFSITISSLHTPRYPHLGQKKIHDHMEFFSFTGQVPSLPLSLSPIHRSFIACKSAPFPLGGTYVCR